MKNAKFILKSGAEFDVEVAADEEKLILDQWSNYLADPATAEEYHLSVVDGKGSLRVLPGEVSAILIV